MKKASKSQISRGLFIRRMAIAVILINLFVIVIAGLSLRQSRLQHEGQAVVTARNLSQVLERYIDGVIDKIDVTLLALSDEIGKQLADKGCIRRLWQNSAIIFTVKLFVISSY